MKHVLLIILLLFTSLSIDAKAMIGGGDYPTAVVNQKGGEEKVMLYPNPAKYFTQVKITNENVKVLQVTVYGILGNQVYSKKFTNSSDEIRINVQNFKKGKYLVKVIFADGTSEVKALIKQ